MGSEDGGLGRAESNSGDSAPNGKKEEGGKGRRNQGKKKDVAEDGQSQSATADSANGQQQQRQRQQKQPQKQFGVIGSGAAEGGKQGRGPNQKKSNPGEANGRQGPGASSQQQQNGAEAGMVGAAQIETLSPQNLPQAMSEVLKQFSGQVARESDIEENIHPSFREQNWRQCLSDMCEFSLLNGTLHPECQDRLAVHVCSDGDSNNRVMISHPAGAPFTMFCAANRGANRAQLASTWLSLAPEQKRPFEEQAGAMLQGRAPSTSAPSAQPAPLHAAPGGFGMPLQAQQGPDRGGGGMHHQQQGGIDRKSVV